MPYAVVVVALYIIVRLAGGRYERHNAEPTTQFYLSGPSPPQEDLSPSAATLRPKFREVRGVSMGFEGLGY